jgi:hypothetical protein
MTTRQTLLKCKGRIFYSFFAEKDKILQRKPLFFSAARSGCARLGLIPAHQVEATAHNFGAKWQSTYSAYYLNK